MEHQEFDERLRALAASGTRRSAFGALAGLLGLALLDGQDAEGESKQKRRRQRRRMRKDRRRSPKGGQRGIKLIVGNPLTNSQSFGVEFGFGTGGASITCCQGQATHTLAPGQQQVYTTASDRAYLWVENRYFLDVFNPFVSLPGVSWAIDGATYHFDAKCCKPNGQTLDDGFRLEVNEMKTLNFNGRFIVIVRLQDEPDFKSFFVLL